MYYSYLDKPLITWCKLLCMLHTSRSYICFVIVIINANQYQSHDPKSLPHWRTWSSCTIVKMFFASEYHLGPASCTSNFIKIKNLKHDLKPIHQTQQNSLTSKQSVPIYLLLCYLWTNLY
ncbi:hypothetical protein ACE6H2_006545 [Prunus campanulata]